MEHKYTIEALSNEYDLNQVNPVDVPYVKAVIWNVCTMERQMPKLSLDIVPVTGFYSLIFKGFNQLIDFDNYYEKFKGPNRDPKLDYVTKVYNNPETGSLVIRCRKVEDSAPTVSYTPRKPMRRVVRQEGPRPVAGKRQRGPSSRRFHSGRRIVPRN